MGHDVAGRGRAEVGAEDGDVAVRVAGTEGAPRRARHGGIVVEIASPLGLGALDGVVRRSR